MQKEAIFIFFDDLEMNVETLLHVNIKGQGKLISPKRNTYKMSHFPAAVLYIVMGIIYYYFISIIKRDKMMLIYNYYL